jgi:hypothetical protein
MSHTLCTPVFVTFPLRPFALYKNLGMHKDDTIFLVSSVPTSYSIVHLLNLHHFGEVFQDSGITL